MEQAKAIRRRRHDAELKCRVLAQCAVPGASVAQVALAHGLNANLVHKWRRQSGAEGVADAPSASAAFIPVVTTTIAAPMSNDIRLELRRGPLTVHVQWPMADASGCAAWMRDLLR